MRSLTYWRFYLQQNRFSLAHTYYYEMMLKASHQSLSTNARACPPVCPSALCGDIVNQLRNVGMARNFPSCGRFPSHAHLLHQARSSLSFYSTDIPLNGTTQKRQNAQDRELHSLNVAIGANILIFFAKVFVHFVTGSSSILAEAMHSMADVFNQLLLRVGVNQAEKAPTPQYPYGYQRDRFVWSLISAVGIFFLGAGASIFQGFHSLLNPPHLEALGWSYGVLALSLLLEGYSLFVAMRSVSLGAAENKMSMVEYIKSGLDPTTVAVMLEDGGAVVGLIIAAVCTGLTHYLGSPVWDALGSICVGVLLGAIASFLVQRNRALLLGRSMSSRDLEPVLSHLARDPVVHYVTDTKTEEIGPRVFRLKAEVCWDGTNLVARYLDRCGREKLVKRITDAVEEQDSQALEVILTDYGRDIISSVGAEVDRIEGEIQKINPGIRYVDLETDRGRLDYRLRNVSLSSFDNMQPPAGWEDITVNGTNTTGTSDMQLDNGESQSDGALKKEK